MKSTTTANGKGRQFGITLVECCVATTIAAATLSAAIPSFRQSQMRGDLQGVSAQVAIDVLHAKSQAVLRSQSVRIEFGQSADGTCYVVHTGALHDCRCGSEAAICRNGAEPLRHVFVPADKGLSVRANVASMVFDATHGTSTPGGTIKVATPSGQAVHQVVNLLGRPRSCSVGIKLPGITDC